jgi:hypothetical protein
MQSRELPRIVTAEAQAREVLQDEEQPRRSRFAGLDFVRAPRRFDWFRLTLVCLMICGGVGIIGYFGRVALQNAVAWLHAQPKYQLAFTDIQLVPPAPNWILGSDRTILRQVLENSGEDSVLSVPALEPGRLTKAFKKSPWVFEVREIRIEYPNRISAHLAYCKPVATVKKSSDEGLIVLDEHGLILPADEIDTTRIALKGSVTGTGDGLIPIVKNNPSEPKDRSPGLTWKSSPADPQLDRRILSAAKLAGFFKRKEQDLDPKSKTPRIELISLNDGDDLERGQCIRTTDSEDLFLWGPGPGEEPPGSLTADEKWALICEWAESRPRRKLQKADDYWEFQKTGLIPVSTTSLSK